MNCTASDVFSDYAEDGDKGSLKEKKDDEGDETLNVVSDFSIEEPLHREKKINRQPQLSCETFLMSEKGFPRNCFFNLYCDLNYKRLKEKKFEYVNNAERISREMQNIRGEIISLEKHVSNESNRMASLEKHHRRESHGRIEYIKNEIRKRRREIEQLQKLKAMKIRNDLNTLLQTIDKHFSEIYPYNEHLEKIATRLEKISTKSNMWLNYRSSLIKFHKDNIYDKWASAGAPRPPHTLIISHMNDSKEHENGEDFFHRDKTDTVGDKREKDTDEDLIHARYNSPERSEYKANKDANIDEYSTGNIPRVFCEPEDKIGLKDRINDVSKSEIPDADELEKIRLMRIELLEKKKKKMFCDRSNFNS